jgi:hypothetical protein
MYKRRLALFYRIAEYGVFIVLCHPRQSPIVSSDRLFR